MAEYDVLFLDADDTLFDFKMAERWAIESAFAKAGLGFEESIARVYAEINGGLWRRLERGEIDHNWLRTERFRLLFLRLGLARDPNAFAELYLGELSRASFLIEGAEALCERLSRTLRLAVITNGIALVQRSRFERSTIKKHVECLVVSEEVGANKPDPRIFQRAFDLLGLKDKSRILVVGDSLGSDIKGGIAFGADTCWFNPRGAAPDQTIIPTYTINRIEEIEAIV